MVVSFIAVALNLALNWLFTRHLGFGHRGWPCPLPAWRRATSSSCTCSCARTWEGSSPVRCSILLAKVALASLALLLVAGAGEQLLLADWAVQSFWPKCILSLLLVIACAAAAFFLCAAALRIGEVSDIVAALRRRIAGRRGQR